MMMVMECMGHSTCHSHDDDGDGVYGIQYMSEL